MSGKYLRESGALEITGAVVRRFESFRVTRQNLDTTVSIFDTSNQTLHDRIGDRDCLIVVEETVYELYRSNLERYLDAYLRPRATVVRIQSGEAAKTITTALNICEAAYVARLRRNGVVVCIGGGACTDVGAFASAIYRRGVPHIRVPTTLVGMIDAGIATKCAINFNDHKNLLGAYHQPESSVIDTKFLTTLPAREIISGMGEVVKLAISSDPDLYRLLREHGGDMVENGCQGPLRDELTLLLSRSVLGMMMHLSRNLYETENYGRAMDFGHTFSPWLEQASKYQIRHGEAVACDIALSTVLSHRLGLISREQADEFLVLLLSLQLPVYFETKQIAQLWTSLSDIEAHRGGRLNLCLPQNVGSTVFIQREMLSRELIEESWETLRHWAVSLKEPHN